MSLEALPSRSFSEWYVDRSMLGHAPLTPSIFIGKVCQWIVSPLDENGFEAMIEMISRILACIVLPVIALLALALIPIGLVTKSIGGCCSYHRPPANKTSDAKVGKPKNCVTKKVLSGIIHVPGTKPSARLSASIPSQPLNHQIYSDQTLSWIAPAAATLKRVNAQLDNVTVSKIDIEVVKSAKQTLKSDSNIRQLREATPFENSERNDPIVTIREKINIIESRIKSLEFIFHYHSKTIEPDGEIEVANNGNCLFEASKWHSEMNGSRIISTEDERFQTMSWIKSNCNSDPVLQSRLVNSIAEHYQVKLEKLEIEQKDKKEMLKPFMNEQGIQQNVLIEGPQQRREVEARLEEISQEMDSLFMTMVQISAAFGEAHVQKINFSALDSTLVNRYIEEMSQSGEHGGAAELYALSCRHKVCVKVHHKNGIIDKDPYDTINVKFIDKPPRHFTHTRNHYNPYFPT